jgi:transcriptional regulator with XRE-family HTH domain
MNNEHVFDMDAMRFRNAGGRITILDILIGLQLQQARKQNDLSQAELGKAIGLSYQQIQKYETGQNRIAASTLLLCSIRTQTTIEFFFETARERLNTKSTG